MLLSLFSRHFFFFARNGDTCCAYYSTFDRASSRRASRRRLLERAKVVGRYDDSSPAFAKLHFFSCLYLLFVQLLPTTLLLRWDASSGRAWKSQIPRFGSRVSSDTLRVPFPRERNSTIRRR